MTIAHRRAAHREREAARLLGGRRVHRAHGQSAPDVEPITLANGEVLLIESKTRAHLPKWLAAAIAQARRYLPSSVPVVALSELGSEPLAVLPLRDFARLLNLQPSTGRQLALALVPQERAP